MSRRGLLPAVGLLAIAIVAALAVVLVSSFASGGEQSATPALAPDIDPGSARPPGGGLRADGIAAQGTLEPRITLFGDTIVAHVDAARSTARRSALGTCGHRVPSMGDRRSAHARGAIGHGHASADDVRTALHGEPVHPSEPVVGARIRRGARLLREARRRPGGSRGDRSSLAGTARVLAVRGRERRRFHGNRRAEPVARRFHLVPRGDVPDLAEPAPTGPDRSRRASRCRRLRPGLRGDPSSPEGPEPEPEPEPEPSHRPDAAQQALELLEDAKVERTERRIGDGHSSWWPRCSTSTIRLARAARTLAWSEGRPRVEQTSGLATRVRTTIDTNGNGRGP